MSEISLSVSGYVFTFNSGDVDKAKSVITPQAENTTVSAAGPMSSRNTDYDGVSKTIVLIGRLTKSSTTRIPGYTILTILAQKQWLESIANGSQGSITFDSTYESQSIVSSASATLPYLGGFTSTTVMVTGLTFEEMSGKPNELPFSMTMIVGSAF